MAIPNVNQITSTLRMLGDQQLQQYAAMHKNDPYILPMAIAESNARKQMRAQGQPQGAGQPQPKVADAAIAGMTPQAPQGQLPEEQGIGALPAQNMQHMADGGIAGYTDGGQFNFAGDSGPVMRMAEGGVARFAGPANQLVGGVAGDIPGYAPSATNFMPQAGAAEDLPFIQRKTREAAEAVRDGTATPQQKALLGWATRLGFGTPALGKQETGSVFTPGSTSGFATSAPITSTGAAPTATGAGADITGAKTPPAPNANPATTPGIPSLVAPNYGGLDVEKMTRKAMEAAAKQPNIFAKDIGDIGKEKVAAKEAEVAGLEAIQQKYSDIFKGRKERQDTKEAEIGKMGEENKGLALLMAGAAMAGTAGPIGNVFKEGVKASLPQYTAGLERINAAKDKLSDARDRLEDLESQRGEMSARELFKARNEIKNTQISAHEDLVKSNMQMYGLNREQALKQVDNQIKIGISQIEQGGANARTSAQIASQERLAAMPTGADRTAMLLGKGDTDAAKLESGMKKLQEITADRSGMAAVKLLAETNAKLQAAGQPPVTMADLLSSAKEYSALMYPKVDNIPKTNMLAR